MTESTETPDTAESAAPAADLLIARQSDVTREMLREGIRQLQPNERDALRLATREQLPISQIATQLELTPDDVESSLRTGLTALRTSIIAQLGGSPT